MLRSCQIIIRELCSLLKLYYSIHNSIHIFNLKVFYVKLYVHSLVDKLKWFYENTWCYNKIYRSHLFHNGWMCMTPQISFCKWHHFLSQHILLACVFGLLRGLHRGRGFLEFATSFEPEFDKMLPPVLSLHCCSVYFHRGICCPF